MLKKFVFILLLFCPMFVWADSDEILGIGTFDEVLGVSTSDEFLGQTVGAVACDTSQQNEDGSDTDNYDVGKNSDDKYFATKFVYSGTNGKAICKIALWLSKTGSPTRNYYARIYSHDAGDVPDTAIGTSDAVASSSVGASEEKVYFILSTPSSALANGTTYWVGLHTTSNDSSNYLNWHITDGTTERIFDSADGSSWAYVSASKTCKWEIYSR